jgi:hypothetical protein
MHRHTYAEVSTRLSVMAQEQSSGLAVRGADPHGESNGAAREGRRKPLRRKPRTKSGGTANCSWRMEVTWRGQQRKV